MTRRMRSRKNHSAASHQSGYSDAPARSTTCHAPNSSSSAGGPSNHGAQVPSSTHRLMAGHIAFGSRCASALSVRFDGARRNTSSTRLSRSVRSSASHS